MYTRGMGQDAGPGDACSWYDNIYATQGCLDWYAANDPTNPFYLLNTKGLIVGGSQVLGATAAAAVGGGIKGGLDASVTGTLLVGVGVVGALYVMSLLLKR